VACEPDTSSHRDVESSRGYRSINRGVQVSPLPNLKKRCTANNRKTGHRCLNPAAFGCKTFRYHGARRQIPKGEDHPNYTHGERTLEALRKYSQKAAELDELERLGHKYGFMEGSKRRGRRPVGE
jgi:hypothetical protein